MTPRGPHPILAAALLLVGCAPGLRAAPSPLRGGDLSADCAWPSAAFMLSPNDGDDCSAVLVHPRVLLMAGHCGTDFDVARFGTGDTRRAVRVARCEQHPDCDEACRPDARLGGDPWDYALCVLEEPAAGAPVVPIAAGCEREQAAVGTEVRVVGFGFDDDGIVGLKREAAMAIASADDGRNELLLRGLDGAEGCVGDSGGPTFLELADGTWRTLAVHHASNGEPCGDRVTERVLAAALPWIEEASGFDVTPCHDADGTWNPGPDCRDLPTDPAADLGAYPMCEVGPVAEGLATTCGPAFGSGVDAGIASADAGSSMPSDAGAERPGDGDAPVQSDAGAPSTPGAGCRVGPTRPRPFGWVPLLAAAALLGRRRGDVPR